MDEAKFSRINAEALTGLEGPILRKKMAFRGRSLRNMLKMGHCAPAAMKTILDICGSAEEWPVRAAAGLPGGIGDTGFECGGITSPLLLLGLRYGLREPRNGLPLVFYKGHDYFRRFVDRNSTPLCREIRGDNFRLTRCIKAVCTSPEIAASACSGDSSNAIAGEQLEAYALLYSHMAARGFHCAHQVFHRLSPVIPLTRELHDATSGYLGGTLFKGMTCSAYAAGVMALGLRMAEIEDSLPRVMRMIVLMKTGRNAFADHLNKFNRIMRLGNSLSCWFKEEFGDTQCQAITGCDFSSPAAVARYIETDALARCQEIAEKVARKVLSLSQTVQAA
jgi:Putative redox-active protein (C_GCAxxG_C_C)